MHFDIPTYSWKCTVPPPPLPLIPPDSPLTALFHHHDGSTVAIPPSSPGGFTATAVAAPVARHSRQTNYKTPAARWRTAAGIERHPQQSPFFQACEKMGCPAWGFAEAGYGGSLSPHHVARLRHSRTRAQCRRVHEFEDKCKFVRENCRDEEVGFFDYLELYYCRFADAPAIPFSIMAGWLVMLFTVGPLWRPVGSSTLTGTRPLG